MKIFNAIKKMLKTITVLLFLSGVVFLFSYGNCDLLFISLMLAILGCTIELNPINF